MMPHTHMYTLHSVSAFTQEWTDSIETDLMLAGPPEDVTA